MWDIKLRTTNEQIRQTKRKSHRHRQHGSYQKERGVGGSPGGEGVKCMVIEGDLTLAGEHTMQNTDDIS